MKTRGNRESPPPMLSDGDWVVLATLLTAIGVVWVLLAIQP